MTSEFWLMDERAMDPDQFADATVYAVAETLEEAREDLAEAGCGVIVKVRVNGDLAEWDELVEPKLMTVQEAVDRVRKIQADLDAGRLRVPYPPEVRKAIFECGQIFMAEAGDTEKARALVARIQAPEPETAELPW